MVFLNDVYREKLISGGGGSERSIVVQGASR